MVERRNWTIEELVQAAGNRRKLENNERGTSEKKQKNQLEIGHLLNFVIVDLNVLPETVYFCNERTGS